MFEAIMETQLKKTSMPGVQQGLPQTKKITNSKCLRITEYYFQDSKPASLTQSRTQLHFIHIYSINNISDSQDQINQTSHQHRFYHQAEQHYRILSQKPSCEPARLLALPNLSTAQITNYLSPVFNRLAWLPLIFVVSRCVTYCSNIIKQMNACQRGRPFEWCSVVLGRNVMVVAFPFKRTASILNNRCYPKKMDYLAKHKNNKNNNQRADIFLQGLQFTKTTQDYREEPDSHSSQAISRKLRNSTPCPFQKLQTLALSSKIDIKSRFHQSKTEQQQSPKASNPPFKAFQTKTNHKRDRQAPIISSYKRGRQHQSNPRISRTDRQRTFQQANHRHKPPLLRIEQKPSQTSEGRELEKAEQPRRKQLFYMSQRELSSIRSQSFIVLEHPSAQIVTGYYYKKILEIASLTKIMTFYAVNHLLAKYRLNADQIIVRIDGSSAEMSGTSAELYEGDHYTVKQLLYALMLPSGNDAAVALARWGGKVLGEAPKDFILLMNRLASQLGMRSSSFGNPHGLPHPQNGSTAQDLSLLVSKCLHYSLFREVIKCRQFQCWTENEGVRRQVIWENTNKLLRRPGFAGVKTGVTVAAGPCLATLYSVKGRQFIVILLRTNKLSRRFKQTRWILAMCLRKLNYDGSLSVPLRELCREDPELDSDNSEEQECFDFERNDHFEFQRRQKILLNEL